jgi:hypothetical protein
MWGSNFGIKASLLDALQDIVKLNQDYIDYVEAAANDFLSLQTVLSLVILYQRNGGAEAQRLTKQVPGSLIQGNRDNSDPTLRLNVEAVAPWSVPRCFRGTMQMCAPHEPQADAID